MKVKEIIKQASKMIGQKDIIESIDESVINDDVEMMITAVNLINNNLASNYVELVSTKEIYVSNDIVRFSEITDKDIIEIKEIVSRSDGSKCDFSIMSDGIHLKNGNYIIKYSYYPNSLNLDDTIDYYIKINCNLFAIGVASEYLFLKGSIDEAGIWDKKFKQALMGVVRPKRLITMPKRRWY